LLGVETIIWFGIWTLDGTYVIWIGTNDVGKAGGGIVFWIVVGITTVVGMEICVITDDGNEEIDDTGTKITVDGIQLDGYPVIDEIITDDGTVIDDGNLVTWIGNTDVGNAGGGIVV